MSPDLETTADLIALARQGDSAARERLMRRVFPALTRWARGRLPYYARDLAETDDLVQVTLIRALSHLDTIDVKGEGAFLAYLRRVLLNAIRDEIRRWRRHPTRQSLPGGFLGVGAQLLSQSRDPLRRLQGPVRPSAGPGRRYGPPQRLRRELQRNGQAAVGVRHRLGILRSAP